LISHALFETSQAKREARRTANGDNIRQRKADAEKQIDTLLDNLTTTNRDFVDRRIEKLRGGMVDLERAEALALELQHRDQQAEAFARQAMAVIRDFDRLVAEGSVEEQRTLLRAFLRVLDFDPITRKGLAHFWIVPSVGQDEFVLGPATKRGALPTPDQKADSRDVFQEEKEGTRYLPQIGNLTEEAAQEAQEEMSSGVNE
jgi:hypothetical protein